MTEPVSIGIRLAIRREGESVNAYLTGEGTMTNAMHIGALHLRLAERPEIWERWKQLMSDALAIEVEEIVGAQPEMIERAAPEHEKIGRA